MSTMSTRRHLRELQWRLMFVAFFFIAGATLAYTYQEQLIPLLLQPLHGEKLVYLNPAGGFSFIFLISIYAGIALAFPFLLQQLYAFLRPALPKAAQKKSSIIIISSILLLAAGIVFGYLVAVPNALTFLYGFAEQYVEASLTAESYLNFMIAYTVGIGIVFQLPLLLLLLHTIKPLTPGGLMKSEKWVVLLAFIVAAIITPTPDPVNQVIIAGPVIVVYQIGVIAVLVSIARSARRAKTLRKEESIAEKAVAELTQPEPALEPALTPAFSFEGETPTPSVVETVAIAELEEPQQVNTPQAEQPIQATTLTQPAKQTRPVDGFTVQRRSAAPLQVPQRVATPTPPARPAQQASPNGFYLDGIIPKQNAAA